MSIRNQGPEHFEDIAQVVLSEQTTQRQLPLDKWMLGLLLEWTGRVAVTVATAGPVLPEAPQSIIERFRIEGQHKRLGQRDFYNVRGATAFEYASVYSGGRTLRTDLGGLAAGLGTFDIRVFYLLWFPPEQVPLAQQIGYAIRGDDWKTLNLRLNFGDRTSLFDAAPGTSVVTFSAFGSGTGSPRVRVHTIRPLLADARDAIRPALTHRTFVDLANNNVLVNSNLVDGFIASLKTGREYRSLLVKTGVRATAAPPSAGVNVYTSLSDSIITRPFVKLDGKNIRQPGDTHAMREWHDYINRRTTRQGYFLVDFVDAGDLRTAFQGQGLDERNKFELHGDVTAAASQIGEVVETTLEGKPFTVR